MGHDTRDIFELPPDLSGSEEIFETLASGDDLQVERIVSRGHATPDGEWYDQEDDEWVILLQGEATLTWGDGTTTDLEAGDALFIEAHCRHRVTHTSEEPPCIWLAVHGEMTAGGEP